MEYRPPKSLTICIKKTASRKRAEENRLERTFRTNFNTQILYLHYNGILSFFFRPSIWRKFFVAMSQSIIKSKVLEIFIF